MAGVQRPQSRHRAHGARRVATPESHTRAAPRPSIALLTFLGLLAVTALAYHPAWRGTLLWDDAQHLTAESLRPASGLWRIWFDLGATQQYYPIVHSAFWIQHRLWGDATVGYHLVNIVLHAAAATLLAGVLRRLTVAGAALAACLFALHPINVESVAWITELKNTLSGVFYFGAALAWLQFDRTRSRQAYAGALALFICALLSKSVTATLPISLIVVAWWRRGSVEWRRDVAPLVPFVALAVAAGALTAWVEHALIGAQGVAFQLTVVERALVAGRALWFYLAAIVWPAGLTFIYPRWDVSRSVWWQYLYPTAAIAVLAVCWAVRARSRAPLAALLLFAAALAPALGFVNVYPFRFSFVADHFAYLATAPILAMVAAVLATVSRRWPLGVRRAGATAIVLALGIATWRQSAMYVDAATLYRATLARNPSAWLAHTNLAALLMNGSSDDVREGVAHARAALRLQPDDVEARYNLAGGLKRLGDLEGAVVQYEALAADLAAAPQERPRMAGLYRSLGNALADLGRLDDAIAQYEASLRYAPESAGAHSDLGVALGRRGRLDEALVHLREAARLEPRVADRHTNAGTALAQVGRLDEAIAEYRAAIALAPSDPDTYTDLGVALLAAGRPSEAAAQFEAALRIDPQHARARAGLANARARGGG
jgi:tetratricopeptide (TPR) repeat protein